MTRKWTLEDMLELVDTSLTECWIWLGRTDRDGYAKVSDRMAHREMYEHLVGPIPDLMEIDHTCLVRNCVNPSHLEAVTDAENNRRRLARITHCPQGHEYTPENTYVRNGTWRQCRACNRGYARRRYYSHRSAA